MVDCSMIVRYILFESFEVEVAIYQYYIRMKLHKVFVFYLAFAKHLFPALPVTMPRWMSHPRMSTWRTSAPRCGAQKRILHKAFFRVLSAPSVELPELFCV